MILSMFTVAKAMLEVLTVLQELNLEKAKAHDLDYQGMRYKLKNFV